MKIRTYDDDAGNLRCSDCSGYVRAGEPCGACARVRDKRRAKRRAIVSVEQSEDRRRRERDAVERWRKGVLARYTSRVLDLSGSERLAFMEDNPVAELFR
jgi:hypothetical protein